MADPYTMAILGVLVKTPSITTYKKAFNHDYEYDPERLYDPKTSKKLFSEHIYPEYHNNDYDYAHSKKIIVPKGFELIEFDTAIYGVGIFNQVSRAYREADSAEINIEDINKLITIISSTLLRYPKLQIYKPFGLHLKLGYL